MELLKFIRLIVIVPMVAGQYMTSEEIRETKFKNIHLLGKDPQQGQALCAKLSKEPYFGVEMLLGNPWTIYYSWNMDLQNQCINLTFMNATLAIVNRFYNDMSDYMETEPTWEAATLLVKMGHENHEMLLFADQGPAGRFQGVPNMAEGNIYPGRRSVPILRFHLKLIYGGNYLLMADCQLGVTTLSTRKSKFPFRKDIGGIVSNLDIGPGHHTCQSHKKKNKHVPKE